MTEKFNQNNTRPMKKSAAFLIRVTGYLILAFLLYSEPLDYHPTLVAAFLILPFLLFYLYVTGTYQKYAHRIPQQVKNIGLTVVFIIGYPAALFFIWQEAKELSRHSGNASLKTAIIVFSILIGFFLIMKLIKTHRRKK